MWLLKEIRQTLINACAFWFIFVPVAVVASVALSGVFTIYIVYFLPIIALILVIIGWIMEAKERARL